ncbi:MAG TPA: AraC family transcriptional regulator [Stackebrandtia sp.]|jgi:AraC-like DNA-binding protein|uniref:helix-turn-helix transcriptional regulator n=1 Tax=Stackebrandtia sp. TaxID=2023065 RepID=UPI002D540E66|nr:AraC family transcriptional regulator [Stackebrandtia sp.]HZE37497.1 AraC family transcriptional regulator [Stackebrandtia sp.]
MVGASAVTAWRPAVAGVAEVLHARFTDHAYPMHTHDSWTLLIVDAGAVRYDLDRHEHGAPRDIVTLLPPHVPHNGCSATPRGFRKRVVYLDADALGDGLIGRAVDHPEFSDAPMRQHIDRLHAALLSPGDELAAEARLVLVLERLRRHLRRSDAPPTVPDPASAARLRDLLDDRVVDGVTLAEASALLHHHPAHLVRAFGGRFGMSPHQYLIGRRVDLARRLLLDGVPSARVAARTGFFDQAHLTRHFRRVLGTTPSRFARSSPGVLL